MASSCLSRIPPSPTIKPGYVELLMLRHWHRNDAYPKKPWKMASHHLLFDSRPASPSTLLFFLQHYFSALSLSFSILFLFVGSCSVYFFILLLFEIPAHFDQSHLFTKQGRSVWSCDIQIPREPDHRISCTTTAREIELPSALEKQPLEMYSLFRTYYGLFGDIRVVCKVN